MSDRDLYAAIAAAQAELIQPTKSGVNPHFKSVYLELPDVHEAAKVFARHGIATVPELITVEGVRVYRCALRMGAEQTPWCEFPVIGASAKPQDVGSALTYARRYALCALYGIAGDKDDDGEAASGRPTETSTRAPAVRESNRSPEGQQPPKTAQKSELPEWVRKDAKLLATLANQPMDSATLDGIADTFQRSVLVASSEGDGEYEVVRGADGAWRCGCKGYAVHKACRHAAIAELHHRLMVLGNKWLMAPETIDEMDRKAARAAIEETADIRAKLSSGAGPWAWAPPVSGGGK